MILVYIVGVKPFSTRAENIVEGYNEACIYLICLLISLCNDNIDDIEVKYMIGWGIIFVTLLNILANNIVLFYTMY